MGNDELLDAHHNPEGRKVNAFARSFNIWGRPALAVALLCLVASCAAPGPGHFHEIKGLTAEEHLSLASAYEEKGELPQALAHYKETFKKGLRDANAYFRAGNLSLRTRQPEYAAYFYQMAIKIDPSNGAFHNNLGWAYMEAGRLQEAEASVAEAVKKDPQRQYAYLDTLAVIQMKKGLLKEAEKTLLDAASLAPASDRAGLVEIYSHLADLYARTKEPEKMNEAEEKIKGLNPP